MQVEYRVRQNALARSRLARRPAPSGNRAFTDDEGGARPHGYNVPPSGQFSQWVLAVCVGRYCATSWARNGASPAPKRRLSEASVLRSADYGGGMWMMVPPSSPGSPPGALGAQSSMGKAAARS